MSGDASLTLYFTNMKRLLSFIISAVLLSAVIVCSAMGSQAHLRKQRLSTPVRTVDKSVSTPKELPKGFHMPVKRSLDRRASSIPYKGLEVRPDTRRKTEGKMSAASELPQLVGSVVYDYGENSNPDGLYRIEDGKATLMFPYNQLSANGGGVEIDGLYYLTYYYEFWDMIFVDIAAYSIADGSEVAIMMGQNDNIASDIAVDPTTGTVYAITLNQDLTGYQLSRMTYTTTGVTTTEIAPLDGDWNALACDASGQLYAICSYGKEVGGKFVVDSSTLCRLDKTTGEVAVVGPTGQAPQYQSSATIDPATGRMFWCVCPPAGQSVLCEVDLATGEATELFAFADNDQVTGMYVSTASSQDKVPAAATGLTVDFPDCSLTGTVSFEIPAFTFDGTPALGSVDYEILANESVAATGTSAYGEHVTADITLPAAGDYTFTVAVSNDVGKSKLTQISKFIGNGVPEKTSSATLSYANGVMTVRWKPVTATVDGGYIDPADVTYSVSRFPGNVKVASFIPETSFSETIEEPKALTDFYYVVVAHNGNSVSAETRSNVITLGSIIPPYANNFNIPASLAGFTIIDGNQDGKSWEYNDYAVRMVYNTSVKMDDWLITPSLYLEKGKTYQVGLKAWGYDPSYPERLEVKWGAGPTTDMMTGTVIEPTVVNVRITSPLELTGYIAPESDGSYYLGIHGISDADRFYLNIDDLTVSEGTSTEVPEAPTGLKAVADENGNLSAVISFRTPLYDVAGNRLTSLTSAEVRRGDSVVKTFDEPRPDEELSFTDEVDTDGTYVYTIQCHNGAGSGRSADVKVFIGVDVPVNPENVRIAETSVPGEVTVSWDPVDRGQGGNPVNPALVQYYVGENDGIVWVPVTEKGNQTSVTFRGVPEGEQKFVQYAVFAETSGGMSASLTPVIAAGTPFTGIEESFAGGYFEYPWSVSFSDMDGEWGVYEDNYLDGCVSQDGDNGFAGMQGSLAGSTSALISAKFRIERATTPGLMLYAYNILGDNGKKDTNTLDLYVREVPSGEWTLLSHSVIHELGDGQPGWQPLFVSLAGHTGKDLQLRIQATSQEYMYTLIDNIRIGNIPADDLGIHTISAPSTVLCGADYHVDVEVVNLGTADAGRFDVTLYADGEEVETRTVDALASGAGISLGFERTMDPLVEQPVNYHAAVSYIPDEETGNNVSRIVAVEPLQSKLPAVESVRGKLTAEGVELSWDEPDMENIPAMTSVVDFEDGGSFDMSYAGWTFVDRDDFPVGGFQGTDIPGITTGVTKMAFMLFDASVEPFNMNHTFDAFSGFKYLAAMFRQDDGTADDWAISPLLDGFAQTVTFMAKSYAEQYPEKIEMYYSTGSLDPADFVKVGETVDRVPGEWTRYSFDIPVGAKHFAVRSMATGGFMLMLDDFTFAAKDQMANLDLKGYDVYRDGRRINGEEPCGETSFTDAEMEEGSHSYRIVAVYDSGISAPSAPLDIVYSGIDTVKKGSLAVTGGEGVISIEGADGRCVRIVSADGKVLFSTPHATSLAVSADRGVYIVKVGDRLVKKVVVK